MLSLQHILTNEDTLKCEIEHTQRDSSSVVVPANLDHKRHGCNSIYSNKYEDSKQVVKHSEHTACDGVNENTVATFYVAWCVTEFSTRIDFAADTHHLSGHFRLQSPVLAP